jgi:hypothetical protein
LEALVAARLKKAERKFFFTIINKKVTFRPLDQLRHRKRRMSLWRWLLDSSFLGILASPVIYAFIVPALILDAFAWIYQRSVFPVFSIPKVERSDYIALDRGQLLYLNWFERFNCDYCGYVNGLIAYAREIAARSEQYFCPIRHALKTLGLHPRHNYFLPYGDAAKYHAKLKKLQAQLRNEAHG